jgi:hypothetical protein
LSRLHRAAFPGIKGEAAIAHAQDGHGDRRQSKVPPPVTRASGKKSSITRRWVKNDRLNHAGYLWAFAALRHSPGVGAHYRRRREIGDWHAAAQRNLFNRMIGQLYHCLQGQNL